MAAQIVALGTLFNLGGTVVNCTVAWAGSAAGRRLRASAAFDRLLRWISATVFAGLALRLAVSERGWARALPSPTPNRPEFNHCHSRTVAAGAPQTAEGPS